MIGPFILLIGLMLLYVTFKGKSPEFLAALDIQLPPLGDEFTAWMNDNIWTPLGQTIAKAIPNPFGG